MLAINNGKELHMQTKKSQKKVLAGMAGCYALGNFNDNFFKQAAILMAATLGMGTLQSVATVLFALPFVLFSAWAGWLADSLQKKYIVVAAKCLELLALALGAVALWLAWWPGIMVVIFIMALQSTIFNPALNGAIPESFAHNDVPRVNSIIRSISTAAILAGIAMAGPLLDARPSQVLPTLNMLEAQEYGRFMAGVFMVSVSLIGLLLALLIKQTKKPINKKKPFPFWGPLDSLKHVIECQKKDKSLFIVMTGDAFFYGLAPIVVISIANLSKQLGYNDTTTSLLSASLMIGIAIGALFAGRSKPESWRRVMIPSLSAMAICLALSSLTVIMHSGLQLLWLTACLLCAGFWGGVYIIPIASFLQVRPADGEKGKILAASNFYSFLSMAAFGAAFALISLLPPQFSFLCYASAAIFFAYFWVKPRCAKLEENTLKDFSTNFIGVILKAILSLRYTVKEQGLNEILQSPKRPAQPILFLPNHPALIDPVIVYSRISGLRPRILSDASRMQNPLLKIMVKLLSIITIPDAKEEGRKSINSVKQGINLLITSLKQGNNALLYPAGRIYQSQIERLYGNSAVSRILKAVPETRVILVRSTGLWGSAFSKANGHSPEFFEVLFKRIPALIFNAIFFMPRRRVILDFCEIDTTHKDKRELNKKIEAYYNARSQAALEVPIYHWQGQKYIQRS